MIKLPVLSTDGTSPRQPSQSRGQFHPQTTPRDNVKRTSAAKLGRRLVPITTLTDNPQQFSSLNHLAPGNPASTSGMLAAAAVPGAAASPFPSAKSTSTVFQGPPLTPHGPSTQVPSTHAGQQQLGPHNNPTFSPRGVHGFASPWIDLEVSLCALANTADAAASLPAHAWQCLLSAAALPGPHASLLSALARVLEPHVFSPFAELTVAKGGGSVAIGGLSVGDMAAGAPVAVTNRVPHSKLLPVLEGRIAAAEAEYGRALADLEDTRHKLDAEEGVSKTLKERVASLDQALLTEKARCADLMAQMGQLTDRSRTQAEAQAVSDRRVEQLEAAVAEMKALPGRVEFIKHQLAAAEANNVVLQTEVLAAMADLRTAQDIMATMMHETQFRATVQECAQLRQQINKMTGAYAVALGKIDALNADIETTKAGERNLTPRPDWGAIGADVPGGLPEPRDGATIPTAKYVAALLDKIQALRAESDDLARNLQFLEAQVAEVQEAQSEAMDRSVKESTEEFLEGLGTGPEVPKFLRFAGRVPNRRLGKGDTEALVREVWEEKARVDASSRKKPDTLGNFVAAYFLRKHGRESAAMSALYNFLHGLQRYTYDTDILCFERILMGYLPIEVHEDLEAVVEKVRSKCRMIDQTLNGGKETGSIPKINLMNLLPKLFPLKADARLTQLRRALIRDAPGKDVDWIALFEEDEEFSQGDFVETLRRQHLDEIIEFKEALGTAIREAAAKVPPGTFTCSMAREAILSVDPNKEISKINETIYRGIGKDPRSDILQIKDPVIKNVENFLAAMSSVLYKRSTKPKGIGPNKTLVSMSTDLGAPTAEEAAAADAAERLRRAQLRNPQGQPLTTPEKEL